MENLKHAVTQELEKNGILARVKSGLRKKLMEAAEVYEKTGESLVPKKAALLDSELGQICAALVKDFLDSFKMTYTLSVFVPETHMSDDRSDIEELESMFQVKSEEGKPLLFSVIEFLMQNAEDATEEDGQARNPPIAEVFSGSSSKRMSGNFNSDVSISCLDVGDYDHIEPVRRKYNV